METLRRALVALRMWWSDGAGSMIVASLALVTARLAFGNAMECLHRCMGSGRLAGAF